MSQREESWHVSPENKISHTVSPDGPNPKTIVWECSCGNRENGPIQGPCEECGAFGNRHPIRY